MSSIPLNFTRRHREIALLMVSLMVSPKSPGEKLKNGSNYWRKRGLIFPDRMLIFSKARFVSFESHSAIMNAGYYILFMEKRF